jgi:hypothetical protein
VRIDDSDAAIETIQSVLAFCLSMTASSVWALPPSSFPLIAPAEIDFFGRFNGINYFTERGFSAIGNGRAHFSLITGSDVLNVRVFEVDCNLRTTVNWAVGRGRTHVEIDQSFYLADAPYQSDQPSIQEVDPDFGTIGLIGTTLAPS